MVVVRAREDDDGDERPVRHSSSNRISKLSMSGFARSSEHMRCTCASRVLAVVRSDARGRRCGRCALTRRRIRACGASDARRRPADRGCRPSDARPPSPSQHHLRVREVLGERDLREPLEGLDVARTRAGDDVVRQLRARELSCPSPFARTSRVRTACRTTAADVPGRTPTRARNATSPESAPRRRARRSPSAATPNSNFVSATTIPRASACSEAWR